MNEAGRQPSGGDDILSARGRLFRCQPPSLG